MTIVPAAICRIFRNNFKRHYLKNKRLIPDFFCISGACIKKKDDYPSLIISEIIDAERRGNLNG